MKLKNSDFFKNLKKEPLSKHKKLVVWLILIVIILSILLDVEFDDFSNRVSTILSIPSFFLSILVLGFISFNKLDYKDLVSNWKNNEKMDKLKKEKFLNNSRNKYAEAKTYEEGMIKYINNKRAGHDVDQNLIKDIQKNIPLVCGFFNSTYKYVMLNYIDLNEKAQKFVTDDENKNIQIDNKKITELNDFFKKLDDNYFEGITENDSSHKINELDKFFSEQGIFSEYLEIIEILGGKDSKDE